MTHLHNIYDLYLECERNRNECINCKEFQDNIVGNLIDFIEFVKKVGDK